MIAENTIQVIIDQCLHPVLKERFRGAEAVRKLNEQTPPFRFLDRRKNPDLCVGDLVHSILASDPNAGIRMAASDVMLSHLRELNGNEAYQEFLRFPRMQTLAHVRGGDERYVAQCSEKRFSTDVTRFNQLTTILRAIQLMAVLPAIDKHSAAFFENMKYSGFLENIDQSDVTPAEYRKFIQDGYRISKTQKMRPSEIPTAFIKMCVTAIRRASILHAIRTQDFSVVGNEDLLRGLDHKTTYEKLHGGSVSGVRFTLISILKKLLPEPLAVRALSHLNKSENFFFPPDKG